MTKPVVSIGIPVWNGEAFLGETLDSLLAQEYRDIEIIILDNISTDRTSEICESYARRDSRIRYILDSSPRDVIQAHTETARLALGEFFMVACDDDWYAPEYISKLMQHMLAYPTVGLAYSGWGRIFPDGSKGQASARFLKAANSKIYNFAHYLLFRTPIPLSFGIVRTELHREALKFYYRADHRGWNHDNLYMLRLLSMARIDSTPDVLFYYRERDREALYKQRGQYYEAGGSWGRYLNQTQHQVSVTKAVNKIIGTSAFSSVEKLLLRLYNLAVLGFYCGPRYLLLTSFYRNLRGKSL